MNEIIYLEPDDDITSVIGRIKEISPDAVSLVIPRGGNIAQSIVNLKLLKREIEKIDKTVSLVANDKISKNLASQVGIAVYSSVQEAKTARPDVVAASTTTYDGSIKINRYNREEEEATAAVEEPIAAEVENSQEAESDPIDKTEAENAHVSEPEPLPKEEVKSTPEPNKVYTERPIKHIGTGAPANASAGSKFRSRNVSSRKKPIIIISSIVVVAALVLSVIFLPKAEASIVLKTENIKSDADLIIDKNITQNDQNTASIPGVLISSDEELTKEFSATGSKNVGTKATGEVTFYNYWDSNPQSIAAGTVISSSGKNFVTNSAVTIPGATATPQQGVIKKDPGTIKVAITASEAGEDYNLPASKFLVSSFTGKQKEEIYAQSSAALAGGTTKTVKVVSEADIKKAKDETSSEINASSTAKLTELASKDNKKIINSTVKFTESSSQSSKKSGEEADKFSYKITLKAETLAYVETSLEEMVSAKITSTLAADQMLVNPEKSELKFDVKEANFDSGKISIIVHFDGKKGKKYDASAIQKKITNQKYGTAISEMQNLAEVEKAELNIWPKFIPRTPLIKSRVQVKFDYIN